MNMEHDGNNRDYVLHVPTGYDGIQRLPLVVNIHGFSSWATEELDRSKWDEMGDRENFVVVAPNGMGDPKAWNAGGLGGGHDDVGFIRTVVEEVASELCIDEKRIFVSGHSNGGAMTHKLGCQAADIFAAIAPICGWTVPAEECNPARPIPVAAVRSLDDTTVRYEGGGIAPSAAADLDRWLQANDCADTPLVASHDGVCNTYTSCAAGTQVMECHPRGEHNFYYATDNLLLPDTLWPFFREFVLP